MWSNEHDQNWPANNVVCRMPNRNRKKKMINCRLPIAGSDLKSAVIATLRPLFLEASFKGLSTRRILRVLRDLRLFVALGLSPNRADNTIIKSKQFQPCLR